MNSGYREKRKRQRERSCITINFYCGNQPELLKQAPGRSLRFIYILYEALYIYYVYLFFFTHHSFINNYRLSCLVIGDIAITVRCFVQEY